MKIPKRYGESKKVDCPWCGRQATTITSEKIPVCSDHKHRELPNMKCVCGDWLDLREGKFGPFFQCMNCGAVNFNKALEINAHHFKGISSDQNFKYAKTEVKEKKEINLALPLEYERKKPKELFISTDDVEYF